MAQYSTPEHRAVSIINICRALGASDSAASWFPKARHGNGTALSTRSLVAVPKLLLRTQECGRRLRAKRLVARVGEQSQRLELTDCSLSEVQKTDQQGPA